MSRTANAAEKASLAKQRLDVFWAVKTEFGSNTTRVWSGLGDRAIDGEEYIGTGTLLTISEITESGDLNADSVKLQLSGVPNNLISLVFSSDYRNARTQILFGFDEHVKVIYAGLVSSMQITEGRNTSVVTVSVDSAMTVFKRESTLRMTNASHQDRYPGDRFFEFVESLNNKPISWGAEGNATLR